MTLDCRCSIFNQFTFGTSNSSGTRTVLLEYAMFPTNTTTFTADFIVGTFQ